MERAGYQPRPSWNKNMSLLEEDSKGYSDSNLSFSDDSEEESDEESGPVGRRGS
jgi:hypothetical protein